jgi:hypothetical protein
MTPARGPETAGSGEGGACGSKDEVEVKEADEEEREKGGLGEVVEGPSRTSRDVGPPRVGAFMLLDGMPGVVGR